MLSALIAGVPSRHIAVIGMMGSGKTSIGRRIAKDVRRPFLDSDALLVERMNMSVADMFATHGETWFREQETRMLAETLDSEQPIVLASGGGLVMSETNRSLLQQFCTVVWLRATPETILARIGDGRGRPLLVDDPQGAVRRLDELRRPIYAAAADIVVDVDDVSISKAAIRVLRALND